MDEDRAETMEGEEEMEEEEAVEEGEGEEGKEEEEGGGGGLECDMSAYKLFHEGSTGAPCLSFDILRDGLGDARTCESPVSVSFVAGTQGARVHLNTVMVVKVNKLSKVSEKDSESESESELDDEEDEGREPAIASASYKHNGGVNRIRATTINNIQLAAAWSELGQVNIYNLTSLIQDIEEGRGGGGGGGGGHTRDDPPMFTFRGHKTEGFAVDWSSAMPGTLATGDCERHVHIWRPQEGGRWAVCAEPLSAHTASVEDIQWSPGEQNVLATCSVDRSLRVWDIRAPPKKACMLTLSEAHSSDINVIHWSRSEPFIASGGDDGCVRVWDLRRMQPGNTSPASSMVAELRHHSGPVSTVEWHPNEGSVLASGGEDDAILQWDLAVERDTTAGVAEEEDIPEQLLFVHKGQKEVKELHWHPQVPGLIVSTAASGFNIFKTISC
ncbi:glutamate-rich WD repeat-containing protein 1-like [Eriocheir sinensis]|uniref:glutamate-rich WD repeat-containing protein 1-like n=1 Tax=Eriocheir sinensis TaxID=95602 RepID=UPI0021C653F2|nr:glutamate-rich WD repeat-containing protein 1-like [Eriocheir sinensis]